MKIHKFTRRKSDGRNWIQYSRKPFPSNFQITDEGIVRPSDWQAPTTRFNRMRGEWVAISASRQTRPFLPPADYCPLCIVKKGALDSDGNPLKSEIPITNSDEAYEWAVFENLFPGLAQAGERTGHCEVILYSSDHNSSFASLSIEQVQGLMRVWRDRSEEVGRMPSIQQVFIFENRGVEVGVTLHHPHGQLYAFHHVPRTIAREHEQAYAHFEKTGKCLVCTLTEAEAKGDRVICRETGVIAYIPEAARLPYEVHITTLAHRPLFEQLTDMELDQTAKILLKVINAYDKLFDAPMPYMMCHHQCKSGDGDNQSYHWHIELYPMLRSAKKLKYLAGVESGTGLFINDTIPELKATELRQRIEK